MKIKSQKDFFAGLMFLGVGAAFAWGATTYNVGSGARMGPGYFPLLLGILLALIGAVITFKATTVETPDGERIGQWAWRPLFFILAANFAFGILLEGLPSLGIPALGLIAGIYALTFISSLAGSEFNARAVFVLATVLAIGSYVTFVWMLKLQFRVWPSFITA
ncbi:tripartite tricarboxylate transporter TctB family protein [Verminephrobacter aporrectodeae subsp. tuberculatae]|uniref:Tripartite tricarboxylate transporter TctB family protein n=1 Tax=Verminephrobacter aporrectodeae subsp. tuberculatae TaxID=1110392 RepID=A0ABT3KRW9_9BURK|nr:tripartite tricarboxylate transporter TctB family protein [Verminephrobacter aporrectodeae]MCW5321072.1 tripartite tricarboxylate transporter TctB family protein [Verminephrobacter aporrectodeae subsp. tuberculatae]MCW8166470.1 tripartite tricarboxylate transporter TctB family protein [Verminephrobacter aporrectodeae subsp. tuberculatae]MCW8170691.1 tripartite tricarboxylate transporter TctB family protein [Verminephrobacter aporrectodeae subsp. tuberculatae]